MKTLRAEAIAAAAALLIGAPSFAQVRDHREIKAPPLRNFSMPQPKRIQLGNGMVIFLQEDHELPIIRGSAVIRGGGRDVPADKAGLEGIYDAAWRTGGTETKSGDQLDEMLETRAASLETGADDDSSSVSFDVLKNDFDFVFPLFIELLQKPAFRQDKIDLAKTQANTGISRRNDEPGEIAGREAMKLAYGTDSPYTRQPEYATIASITRDDLLAFHKRFVHPNNIILGVVGDFDSAAMERKLRSAFGSWKRGPQAPPPATGGTPAKPGVYFVAKEDVTQANIHMVHPGAPLRSDPDYASIQVMNEILGGGFSGRLLNQIRSKMGLAYGAGGGISTAYDHPAHFRVQTSTKSETMMQALEALRGEVRKLHTEPFTGDELSLAKESILNAFVFSMDSRGKVLNQRMLLEFYGYPADFFQQYPTRVRAVTAEDVARVARKYVRPDQMAILVVGKESGFDKPLSSLGTVTAIDITIPEPGAAPRPAAGGAAAPAPAASTPEAKALVGKVASAAGGAANIAGMRTVRTNMAVTMKTPAGDQQMEMETTARIPDAVRRVMKTAMGEITMIVSPDTAWVTSPMGSQDLPGSQRDQILNEMRTDILGILRNMDDPKYIFTLGGTEKVGDVNAQTVNINADGTMITWYVDPATGRVLRTSRQGRQGLQMTDYADWKTFGGITIPTTFTVTTNGEQTGKGTVSAMEVNPAVDAGAFAKPPAK